MTETLTGVPEIIHKNKRQFYNEYGQFHVHSILFLDGTKATLNTKDSPELPGFKVGEECKYHILEHLKDDVKKIKYGEPWTGGDASKGKDSIPEKLYDKVENKDDLIVREVCVKAAAVRVSGTQRDWQSTAEEMYLWITAKPSKVEWQEPPKEEDEDLPF